jgi:hypothetical protein
MSRDEFRSRVCKAIQERRIVRFHYEGGIRQVEPYAYGAAASGKELLIAYQIGGYSTPTTPPGWNLFEVSRMEGLIITNQVASGLRPGYQGIGAFETTYARVEVQARSGSDRRRGRDRRSGTDRRKKQVPIDIPDRRKGVDRRRGERRSGKERRKGQ